MNSINKKFLAIIITSGLLGCTQVSVNGKNDSTPDLLPITYSLSYKAGYLDINQQWIGGTETMNIIEHQGKLYAGVSYWMDLPYLMAKGDEPWTGSQVLVKDTDESPWRLDTNLGESIVRAEAVISANFTTDKNGKSLDKPVNILITSAPDANQNVLHVWSRDDDTNQWIKIKIVDTKKPEGARSLGIHKDKVTNVSMIFAGSNGGEIFSGHYDPSVPGRLVWNPEPELLDKDDRVMAFTVANGAIYCSVGRTLYKRTDGIKPVWKAVYQWSTPKPSKSYNNTIMRGLTTIKNPNGPGEVIIAARENPGVIERIDPAKNHEVTVEINVADYFSNLWSTKKSELIMAYNDMTPFHIPGTDTIVHLIGLQMHHPDRSIDVKTGYYMVRWPDGTYSHGEMNDPLLSDHPEPRAIRCFRESPWKKGEFFAGGFDCNGKKSHNTAWMMKGKLNEKNVNPYTWFYNQDKNGDGCLSYQECPSPLFKQLDTNGDGLVCLDEYEAYLLSKALKDLDTNGDGLISQSEFEAIYCNTNQYFNDRIARAQSSNGQTLPDSLQTQPDPLGFTFHRDLFTGTKDINGKLLQGTEITAIIPHQGKLFASLGGSKNCNHPNNATYSGYAVLRKDTNNSNWVVDYDIGDTSFRISTMYSAKFTTNSIGEKLIKPKEILIAANWAGTQSVVIRDDNTNSWAVYPVTTNYTLQPGEGFTARSMISYKDKVTGVDYLFMGSHLSNQKNYGYWPSSIYRAAYNPSVAGGLQWSPQAELNGVGRIMAFAICNGVLYAACGILDSTNLSGGIFKRIDGPNPKWQQVYRWTDYNLKNYDDEVRIMRGLTTVPNPNNANQEVLIAFRYFPEPLIERIDPNNNYQAMTEVKLKDFFGLKWHGQGKYSGPIRCAYNGFTRLKDPTSGNMISITGLQIYHPDFPNQPHNGSYYLIRRDDGTYNYGAIYDPVNLVDTGNKSLDATRYIVSSPFAEDKGQVFYFGGYDGCFINNRTAWIYKGKLVDTKEDDPKPEPKQILIELWIGKTSALVDGKPITLDVPPMIKNGRTVVPLRFIAESIQASVDYNAKDQKIVINLGSITITLQLNNQETTIEEMVEGKTTSRKITLESPPFILQGRTLVPIRFISEAFGLEVLWDSGEQKITISNLKKEESNFVIEDVKIGSKEVKYHDIEINQQDGLATFLDSRFSLWVNRINPDNGAFFSTEGSDFLISTGISKWTKYSNGPEWGKNKQKSSIYYVKDNTQGFGQIWRAEPPWNNPINTMLTTGDTHNWLCEPSINDKLSSTRIICYHGNPSSVNNSLTWFDEEMPGDSHLIENKITVARFCYNSSFLTYAKKEQPTSDFAQVVLYNTDTKESKFITNDEGNKIDPWLWKAPEYADEILLCVNIDQKCLGIYRDIHRNGSPWERIATITLPSSHQNQPLKSIEPVNGGNGAFGQSYFTVQAGLDENPDTSIWLFGFHPNGNHLVQRLDDGGSTGKKAKRLDPESYLGKNQLFVYYSYYGEEMSELHCCKTPARKDS